MRVPKSGLARSAYFWILGSPLLSFYVIVFPYQASPKMGTHVAKTDALQESIFRLKHSPTRPSCLAAVIDLYNYIAKAMEELPLSYSKVPWRSFHRSLYWNGFSGPFLGTQKVALGSCMCFQAGCGEIQPCFMRYCWGPGLFATEICITVEAPLKTVAEFPPFMAPEDIRFGATLRNDSDNFSPAFAG